MNEKKNPQMMNEENLEKVSGGGLPDEAFEAKYTVGQAVRFHYLINVDKEYTGYEWVGTIVEVLNEPEGVFYNIEVGEDVIAIVGRKCLMIYYESILGLA